MPPDNAPHVLRRLGDPSGRRVGLALSKRSKRAQVQHHHAASYEQYELRHARQLARARKMSLLGRAFMVELARSAAVRQLAVRLPGTVKVLLEGDLRGRLSQRARTGEASTERTTPSSLKRRGMICPRLTYDHVQQAMPRTSRRL